MSKLEKFLIVLLILVSVRCDQELFAGVSITPNKFFDTSKSYYFFNVPSNVEPNSMYLTFDTANVGEDASDPDIFISTTRQHPFHGTNEWKCTNFGQDICIVPKNRVEPNKTFHITVYCESSCHYKITARMTDEKQLLDGEGLSGELQTSQSQIFSFFVPNDQSITSVSINLGLGTTNTSMVRMFVSRADTGVLPTSQSSVRGLPMWLGLAARIYNSDHQSFCLNCMYRVLVTANVQTTYVITYKTNMAITKVKGDRLDTYEIVYGGERNCYEYAVKSKEETLQVSLNVYSGNSDIFVNPFNIPNRAAQFAFYSTQCLNEILTITPKQRLEHNAAIGNYYVCIYGRLPSAYNLMIYSEIEQETNEIEIHSGLTRTMSVKAGETKFFRYEVDNKNVPRNIKMYLISITGNADFYVKYCKMSKNSNGEFLPLCIFKESDYNDPRVHKSDKTASVEAVPIQLETTECEGENLRCVYLIAVKGVLNSRFSLSIVGENVKEMPMAEGIPIFGQVGLYQYNHYLLHVEDPDTTTLRIQLTSLSGDADLYLSRVNPYCGCLLAERGSIFENHLPDTLIFYKERDGKLNTTYHISVFGFTEATYSLYYTTIAPEKTIRPVWLYDGQPQNGIINGTSAERSIALYQFAVEFDPDKPHNIGIVLTPLSGKYNVFVAAGYVPTSRNFTWRVPYGENSLQISYTDAKYKHNATYNVLIERFNNTKTTSAHSFIIKYYTGLFITTLLEGLPEMGALSKGKYAYFQYNVVNFSSSIIVTVTPFSGNPDLFISINKTNKLPSKRLNDYVSSTLGADSITIKSNDLIEKNTDCDSLNVNCAIYIGVICESYECTFSLQVARKDAAIIKLLDGVPQYGSVDNENPVNYLITPTEESNILISAYPKKGSVIVYASIVSLSNYLNNRNRVLPSPKKHDFASVAMANAHTISISSTQLSSFGAQCRIIMSVYQSTDRILNETSEYMIVSSSNITYLADSIPIVDHIIEKSYKYYFFNVQCVDCTLSISLTPLSQGDPDVYVNKGIDNLPNIGSSDFRATTYRGDFLQISSKNKFFTDNPEKSFQGTYTIGIFDFHNCSYSLVVTTSTSIVQELALGIPVKKEVRQGTISYFAFYCWRQSTIRLSLSVHHGRAMIRANVAKNLRETNVLDVLPVNEVKSTWSSAQTDTSNSLIISKEDSKFMSNGVYLFAVEALESCTYDITVEYHSDLQYTFVSLLEPYRVHLKSNEVKRIAFEIYNKAKITMNIYNIYGNIDGKIHTDKEGDNFWKVTGLKLSIDLNDPKFKIGTYYATFVAKEDSEFILTIGNSPEAMFTLGEGLPLRSEITPGNSAYFYYPIPIVDLLSKSEGRFSVSVTFFDPVTDSKIYIKKVTKDNPSMPDSKNFDIKINQDPDTEQLGGTFKFSEVSGTSIAIAVTGTVNGTKATFDISAWTSGVVLLANKNKITQEISSPDTVHIYEVNINKASQLFVEVVPCVGEVEFTMTKKIASINDKKYDLKKAELNKGSLFGTIDAPVGNYYIAVRGIGIDGNKVSQYTIQTIVKDSHHAEEKDDYYIENYGTISYSVSDNKLYLKWGKVMNRADGGMKEMKTKYKVYLTIKGRANMHTVCGIKKGDTKEIEETRDNSYTYKIPSKYLGETIEVNIIAKIKHRRQSFAFNPVVIQMVNKEPMSYIIMGMIIVGIAVLTVVSVWYFVRYRRIQKQLDYEIKDITGLPHISTEVEIPLDKTGTYAQI